MCITLTVKSVSPSFRQLFLVHIILRINFTCAQATVSPRRYCSLPCSGTINHSPPTPRYVYRRCWLSQRQ